jgi:putative oxidoreductase
LQRLFSTFANGWPGVGLLLQRILTATLLVRFCIVQLTSTSVTAAMIPQSALLQIVATCGGILLLVGLWTPVVGTLIAVVELWIALNNASDPWIPIMLATLGGTAAMIGPGAFSIDARLFGRKRIET